LATWEGSATGDARDIRWAISFNSR
jgi:hypothetical protein